ncbi:hypothetical protein HED63_24935 [Ochrobactrum cytisi]|nr:hypothetical protein [Brucella cytisi]
MRALTTVSGTNEASYGPPDLNGNLSGLTEGGVISTFTLNPGTDQIATVITGDTPVVPCTWNAHGNMLSGNGRNYTYDRASGWDHTRHSRRRSAEPRLWGIDRPRHEIRE